MLKKMGKITGFIIATGLVFLAVNLYAAEKRSQAKKSEKAPVAKPRTAAVDTLSGITERQLVVYYFMTTYRCRSCTFIEGTTRKGVDEHFSDEQKSGRVLFKMVNIDEPSNKHFIDEYGLFTKSVVLSDLKSGKQTRWKNLDQVWNLIGQDDEFKAYIAKEVRTYLGS